MEINRQDVEKRRDELVARREQLVCDLNAVAGAIQDCEHWLSVLDTRPVELVPKKE